MCQLLANNPDSTSLWAHIGKNESISTHMDPQFYATLKIVYTFFETHCNVYICMCVCACIIRLKFLYFKTLKLLNFTSIESKIYFFYRQQCYSFSLLQLHSYFSYTLNSEILNSEILFLTLLVSRLGPALEGDEVGRPSGALKAKERKKRKIKDRHKLARQKRMVYCR